MADQQSYDVVVVNYQSTGVLLGLLQDFRSISPAPRKLIVVDNNSIDRPERIKERFPETIVLRNQQNRGFAAAANQGWRRGDSPVVLFINPDVRLLQDSFAGVLEYLRQRPEVGAVGPRILDPDGAVQGSARGFHSFWTMLAGRKGPLVRLFPHSRLVSRDVPAMDPGLAEPMTVDWVSGACLFVKREALCQVKGFDERYFMYFEDTDLARSMKKSNLSTVYFPASLVSHQVGKSSEKRPLKSLWRFHQSWYRYMCKHHFPSSPLLQMIAAQVVGLRFLLYALLRSLPRKV
ncbi:MAG: glycosyltransferase family 2 protein [Desulfarculaceae bacterium]|nr:glycosyltransferase family 2 protein [Desulfarculaceae bacterium]MCF8072931.1 glycosyltransferase family 2 protein [Desulfarculaceae bacterium]MCF8101099.1 glycosyltransferase family 2 protein [Desulfarculaceae bacterium]